MKSTNTPCLAWKCAIVLLSMVALCSAENVTTSPAPTTTENATTSSPAPTTTVSLPPTVNLPPTVSPAPTGNMTVMPTMTPTVANNTTQSPSFAPTASNATSVEPSTSPTKPPESNAPTLSPTNPNVKPTDIPTSTPTSSPTEETHHKHHHHKPSAMQILGKTLAWMIIIGLSVLLFGACMSNRYRIHYYLKSGWYSFLRWERTQWVIRKLHLERIFGGQESSLNEIIFDNDLNEGLLMQDT